MDHDALPFIPLRYDSANSHDSALQLVLTLRPEWKQHQDSIDFVRFTDGITNTVRQRHAPAPIPAATLALNAPSRSFSRP